MPITWSAPFEAASCWLAPPLQPQMSSWVPLVLLLVVDALAGAGADEGVAASAVTASAATEAARVVAVAALEQPVVHIHPRCPQKPTVGAHERPSMVHGVPVRSAQSVPEAAMAARTVQLGASEPARHPLLVTADPDLLDDVLRIAAEIGVLVDVAPDPAAARRWYASAP